MPDIKAIEESLEKLKKEISDLKNTHEVPQAPTENPYRTQDLTYQVNTLEQYTRRNSVRFHNIPSSENEDTSDLIMQVCQSLNLPINRQSIDVSHRVKARNAKPNVPEPIIVKFVRREDKISVIKNKRKLSDTDHKDVFIHEDLTSIWRKMLEVIKRDLETNQSVFTKYGKIFLRTQVDNNTVRSKLLVDTYADFIKLGFTADQCRFIGLFDNL